MANIKVDTIELPAHWASFLINNDASGLTKDDVDAADAELDTLCEEYCNARIVSVDFPDRTFIDRYDGLQTEMLTYTFHYDAPAGEPSDNSADNVCADCSSELDGTEDGAHCAGCEAEGREADIDTVTK